MTNQERAPDGARKVRKLCPAGAGLGTRFPPQRRRNLKDADGGRQAANQYVVEECVASGIEHIVSSQARARFDRRSF